jgi:nickel/cobalt transporter (NicO) family protein
MIHLSVSGAPGEAAQTAADMREADSPGPMERLMAFVRSAQKELTQRLNTFGMELANNPFGPALWLFLGLSFVYGVVHAVGPGHGKAVVCSYFLANPGSLAAGAIMGNVITFVHMGSAAVAVGAAYMIFSSGMGGFAEASRAIQPASYGLLALMGLFLVIKAVRDIRKGGLLSPACNCAHENEPDDLKSILTVSFVTGLIPCPGAAVILAFAIGLNIFWTGVLALVCMALGMGLTTTLFAWFAVTARSVTLQLTGSNKVVFNRIYAGLSICGASAIALFGGALFFGSISG